MRSRVVITSLIIFAGLIVGPALLLAATNSVITATTKVAVCGDGLVEGGEQCDGANLNGKTCALLGFSSGTLSCLPACLFSTSACIAATNGGSPGGSNGGGAPAPSATVVHFYGWAYPNAVVTILADGQTAATVTASADARFQASVLGLTGGSYTFAVSARDASGQQSALQSYLLVVASGTENNVVGILIPPTMSTDKQNVRHGETIVLSGQVAPSSAVTITVHSQQELSLSAVADATGVFRYSLLASALETGLHHAKARAILNGAASDFGTEIVFNVDAPNVTTKPTVAGVGKSDLNGDGKVNLVDFSILAYWFKRPGIPSYVDLNGDGKVNLVDFSILAYYWTG